ncbi:DUF5103 domain-containing protein [Fulvivirgaceae bacterium BMA10]|uniref:DUF5103 domain-containing protein n=1 Tax=Splendidivirga corallicola TaxID=3051826 RepID=A0ABT8KRC8_9BACT|nr:DUF5103 domain-containing protein [Fulvivirgaceae bacterium BMA10]
MNKIRIIILTACIFHTCVPLDQPGNSSPATQKKLIYDDHVYEKEIKTVQLYPTRNGSVELTQPPIIPINQLNHLVLSFDDLYNDVEDYRAKIIHCNTDWTPSRLSNMDYLDQYNEVRIDQFEQSFNTRVPYIHYTLSLPKVKVTGNYIVAVYRGSNENDLILTKRFMIFSNDAIIKPNIGLSGAIVERNTNQQIEFEVSYAEFDIYNPLEEVSICIRQNQRWDNAITDLKPTFINEGQRLLTYQHFDLKNNFKAGNEFRFFDLRSVNFPGQNVFETKLEDNKISAFLMKDKNRSVEAFTHLNDLNGQYIIEKVDASNPDIESDYVNVHFFLEAPREISRNVHIIGALTDWHQNQNNKMYYEPELKGYVGKLLLKQGWYNYLYYTNSPDNSNPYQFEGSHYQTNNFYEILVYYRPIGGRADQLIGYQRFNSQ